MKQINRSIRKKGRFDWDRVVQALRSRRARCCYVLLVCTVLLCSMFLLAISPQRYDLKVGDISHTTITASKDVVDEITTTRQREEAAKAVEPTYIFKDDVAGKVVSDLKTVLAQVRAVQQYGSKQVEKNGHSFTEADYKYVRSLLTQISFADYQLRTLLNATDQQMADMHRENR